MASSGDEGEGEWWDPEDEEEEQGELGGEEEGEEEDVEDVEDVEDAERSEELPRERELEMEADGFPATAPYGDEKEEEDGAQEEEGEDETGEEEDEADQFDEADEALLAGAEALLAGHDASGILATPLDIGDDLPAAAEEASPQSVLEEAASEDGGVIRADQLVQEARNAWLQAKDPNKLAQNRAVLRGSLQQIFTSQQGTDLRKLRPTSTFDDENVANTAAPVGDVSSERQPADAATPKQPARGRWASQQPVVIAPMVQEPAERSKVAKPKRGGRLKRADEGGPASIVAPAGHMQRLEQLRIRTVAARTMWQTAGALEALRLVATHDDPALSASILRTVAGQLAGIGAAEVALALTLARPLLVSGIAASALKPLAALLHATKRHAPREAASGSASAASAGAQARLLAETKAVCAALDELRVNREGAGASSFDEQFAFGQALALAREAGREAWRALDSESFTAEVTPMPGRRVEGQSMGGRRAW